MAINHLTIDNETREFVWKIEQKTAPKPEKTTSKTRRHGEPTLVKDAVNRYFNKISEGLFERLEALENQVKQLQAENTQLRENCDNACCTETQYVTDNIYNPWYH